jgi:hypothetical protein
MAEYPESEKLTANEDEYRTALELLEYLEGTDHLKKAQEPDFPNIAMAFVGVDPGKIAKEQEAMLAEL